MGKKCKLTKEQCEMLDIEYETDPEVQKEMDMLDALNKKYANTFDEAELEASDEQEKLYAKKVKEAKKKLDMCKDFDLDEIIITKNETGLPDIMFF